MFATLPHVFTHLVLPLSPAVSPAAGPEEALRLNSSDRPPTPARTPSNGSHPDPRLDAPSPVPTGHLTLPRPPSGTQRGPPAGALPAGQTARPAEHKRLGKQLLGSPLRVPTNAGRIPALWQGFLIIAVAREAAMRTAEVCGTQECTVR